MLSCFNGAYRGKRVFLSGHTGFKGSWLAEWLLMLGAEVTGYALPPETDPALFEQLGLAKRLHHIEGDVRDLQRLKLAICESQPNFLFHLAAQPLVRRSYSAPLETYSVNVMGTVNVMEALREQKHPCATVFVTTDKCYENREWIHGYREEDPLGGHDPYSSSKAAAEIAISSFRRSFFSTPDSSTKIASARAGNVIGGGDWAQDRIVPDMMRALANKAQICVRNPRATRPWQHVLEPLSGYLWLGAALAAPAFVGASSTRDLASAFNFGPNVQSNRNVGALVEETLKHWPGGWEDQSNANSVHEAHLLHLVIEKAYHFLQWQPVWSFAETIANTAGWYQQTHHGKDPRQLTQNQICSYVDAAGTAGLPWAGISSGTIAT